MNDNRPKNVTEFDGFTKGGLPPDRVLLQNLGQLQDVVLVGYDQDGELVVCTSAGGNGALPLVNFMLDQAKAFLIEL